MQKKKRRKLKKGLKITGVVFGVLFAVLLIVYCNYKSFLLKQMELPNGQRIYVMGSIHENHFKPYANYSIEQVLNVVENLEVDAVFIEAREAVYKEYGVVDGPVEMSVIDSYCKEHQLPVEYIDAWEVTNETKLGTTSPERDKKIHENVMKAMERYDSDAKVLLICGAGHFGAQTDWLKKEGGTSVHISNKSKLFRNDGKPFVYPQNAEETWEKRAYYYAYTLPALVKSDDSLNESTKAMFGGNPDGFYKQQLQYCELFRTNKLYLEEE